MKKIKVLTVFGTRPEAIKMAPLVKELEKREEVESIVCITAQHREMLDQVMDIFDIRADYDLNIMQSGQTLSDITSRAMKGIEETIKKAQPDIVLVHGDTTTTFAGALASFYCQTKVGHVEAGLRTYDKYSPFPEEMNRCLTTYLADLYFAPTKNNVNNLLRENVNSENIYITGMMLAYTPSIDADYLDAVPVSVHMANTKTSRILDSAYGGSFIDINTMTEVYDLDMQLNGEDEQYNEMWIRFDQPFEYDCTKNLVVDIYKKLEEQYYNVGWYVDYSSGISYRGAYWSNGYDYEMDPQHTSMNYVPYTKFSYMTNLGVQSVDVSTLTYKVQGDCVVYSATCDEVDIYNMAGVRVKSLTDVSRVDISSLGAGVYLIAAKTSQNSIVHKVLVK